MDGLPALTEAIKSARHDGVSLNIKGGGSKHFLGYAPGAGIDLETRQHTGIMSYVPEELIIRVRGGTRLAEVEAILAEQGQMLAFEPPSFCSIAVSGGATIGDATIGDATTGGATIGGAVAAGLSGSRRPYAGAVKDFVLGVGLISGEGDYNEFGGQVMKNVAGYDVSRLVCGSLGILGVIADVSLKVLPRPACEQTIRLVTPLSVGIQAARTLLQSVSTLTGAGHLHGALYLRFSGVAAAVAADRSRLQKELQSAAHSDLSGGVPAEAVSSDFWRSLDSQQCEPFMSASPGEVWRLSTSADEPVGDTHYDVVDWGGAQRWLVDPGYNPRDGYQGAGHWTLYKTTGSSIERFHPLSLPVKRLHRRLKQVFDPAGILNPGRMYHDL